MEKQQTTVSVISPIGEVTLEESLKIKNLLSDYIKVGVIHIVLEMDRVTHVQLSALPVLRERSKRCRDYGGMIVISGASKYLKNIFALGGVMPDFVFAESTEDAIRRIQGEP